MDCDDEDDFERGLRDLKSKRVVSQSERDLTRQLELARKNSRNQHNQELVKGAMEIPIEETIYEGMG